MIIRIKMEKLEEKKFNFTNINRNNKEYVYVCSYHNKLIYKNR
jgi:hypothetical protein